MALFLRFIKSLYTHTKNTNIVKVLLFAAILNIFFGTAFYFAERVIQEGLTYWDALWWAMVTMTTVGYGDFYAQTFIGRFVISYPTMLLGIGIIGYLVGTVADSILERAQRKRKGELTISMENHIIICNFPSLEKIIHLKEELKRSRQFSTSPIVLISNQIEELPSELVDLKIGFVKGDPVREDVLEKANIQQCDGVFVLAQDADNSQSDTQTFAIGTQIEMIEKESGRPIRVVVELVNKDNLKMMRRSGVDAIVTADGIMDVLIAQEFMYPGVHDLFQEVLSNASGSQFYILENRLHGFSFGELQKQAIDFEENLQILGLRRNNHVFMNHDKKDIVQEQDKLIVLANHRAHFEQYQDALIAQKQNETQI